MFHLFHVIGQTFNNYAFYLWCRRTGAFGKNIQRAPRPKRMILRVGEFKKWPQIIFGNHSREDNEDTNIEEEKKVRVNITVKTN